MIVFFLCLLNRSNTNKRHKSCLYVNADVELENSHPHFQNGLSSQVCQDLRAESACAGQILGLGSKLKAGCGIGFGNTSKIIRLMWRATKIKSRRRWVNTHLHIGTHECIHTDTHTQKKSLKKNYKLSQWGELKQRWLIHLGQIQEIWLTCNFAAGW